MPLPPVKGQIKTSVFPAFNANYKTRRRTFRCCRNCRTRRTRCTLTDSYEIYGCDDCRSHKLDCDLISAKPAPAETEPPTKKHRAELKTQRALLKSTSSDPNFTLAWTPLPQTKAGSFEQNYVDPGARDFMSAQPGNAPSDPQAVVSSLPAPEALQLPSGASTAPFATHNFDPLAESFQSPPIHGNLALNADVTSFTPSKSDVGSGATSVNGQTGSQGSARTPISLSPDNVDQFIHKVDWRLLKRAFNFNTSIKETAVYYAKSLSRKETKDTTRVTLTEVLSRKHRNKRRFLSPRNSQHFRFLLFIHAFTLNSPGFFDVTQSDLLKLFEIYFYKVNSIFPIVHEQEFWELYKKDKVPNIMVYAIVIIAARDDLSIPILQRSFHANGASFKDNQNRLIYELEAKVRQLLLFLPELEDTEKLTRLTTQLLLSLNFTFNKFGNEQSSHDLFDCVSYAFSLLFHHHFFHERLIKEGAEKKSMYLQQLWWVIFIFDRFNALLNGKAVVIKRSDFNIKRPETVPHLDRIVTLAYALEDTLIAAFRPPRTIKGKETVILETLPGDPVFKSSEYVKEYNKISSKTEALRAKFSTSAAFGAEKVGCLPDIPVSAYRERHVLFLEEIIRSHLGLILRTGHLKSLKTCDEIDDPSLKFSQTFLDLLVMLKNGQGYELVMPIPLIPLIMLVGLSVPLTSRMRMASKLRGIPSDSQVYRKMVEIGDLCDNYIKEFEILGQNWWFVHEVMESIEGFNRRVESSFSHHGSTERKKPPGHNRDSRRDILSINSLVTYEDTNVPAQLSMTSPGFYDEVIDDEPVEEEESDTDDSSDEGGGFNLKDQLLYHLLVPPAMGISKPEPPAVAPEPERKPSLALSSSEASPFGNQFQFVNENAVWDREFLAEQFDDESSFFPNILHYFSEQPKSL